MRQLQAIVGTKGGQILFFSPARSQRVGHNLSLKGRGRMHSSIKAPRAAGTISALLSHTSLVGGQTFLTFYTEL